MRHTLLSVESRARGEPVFGIRGQYEILLREMARRHPSAALVLLSPIAAGHLVWRAQRSRPTFLDAL